MEITPEILYAMYIEAKAVLTKCTAIKDVSISCGASAYPIILIGNKEFKVSVLISNHPDEDDEDTPA